MGAEVKSDRRLAVWSYRIGAVLGAWWGKEFTRQREFVHRGDPVETLGVDVKERKEIGVHTPLLPLGRPPC